MANIKQVKLVAAERISGVEFAAGDVIATIDGDTIQPSNPEVSVGNVEARIRREAVEIVNPSGGVKSTSGEKKNPTVSSGQSKSGGGIKGIKAPTIK